MVHNTSGIALGTPVMPEFTGPSDLPWWFTTTHPSCGSFSDVILQSAVSGTIRNAG